jgi:protein-S-isoprenylcysteine O-methyltransferase Ste14
MLILKSNLEEKLLTQRFSDYPTYKKKTGRFIPFL